MANKQYFLSDEKSLKLLSDDNLKYVEENVDNILLWHTDFKGYLKNGADIFTYLSTSQFKEILVHLVENNVRVGILPHPENDVLQKGYSVPTNFLVAFDEIKSCEKTLSLDLLFCNDEPIFHQITTGKIMQFFTAKSQKKGYHKVIHLFRFFRLSSQSKSILVNIKSEEKDAFETAISELLIVQNSKNAAISRLLLSESFKNDGLFHCFLFAPRSIIQMVRAYLLKVFLGVHQSNKEFDFLGHIKSERLELTFTQEIPINLDNQINKIKKLSLVINKQINLIPNKKLTELPGEATIKRTYQVANLPTGEAKRELVTKRLPWIQHASTEEFKELFKVLRENAKPRQTYVVLMMLSTILASFGLFSNSSPVVIGAMILAPLMSPIISVSMGVLRQDKTLIKSGLVTIGIGVAVGLFFAILLTIITPIYEINKEILARTNPNIIDLGIAVVSGAAGAYAHAKEEIAKTLAGVAIAVALVPPLAVSGIGIGLLNFEIFSGAFLLLLTNLTGMVLAGALTFLLVGYSPFRLARRGLLISLLIVSAISIPLGYGFFTKVQDAKIISSLSNQIIDSYEIQQVNIIQRQPLKLGVTVVSSAFLEEEEIQLIKENLEQQIDRDIKLEISVKIRTD